MDRWRGRVALVTGASVGIGAAIAKELVRHGMKVVGCARDVERIQKLAAECQSAGYSGVLLPYKCDLTNEEEILSMFSAIKSQHEGVDVCINNAGLGHAEPLLSGRTSGWKDMFDVNVLALCICTREAYQSMKERNVDDGHIIHINSMSGHVVLPIPDTHFYSCTKFAVTALTEGLRQELREANTHIRATKLAAECQSAGYSGVLLPYKCDLTKEEDILSMFSAIKSRHKGVDVCINNAGLAHPEPLLSGRTSGWKEMFDVNVLALCICTREAYQSMKERNVDDGQIIHINSMTGHRVVPSADVHVYCATKFAVTALLEGLRLELREANTHIRASCISPGVVETEFTQRLYRDKPEIASTFPFFDMKPLEAVDVANAVTFVLSAPPHVQIGEVQMRPVRQVL